LKNESNQRNAVTGAIWVTLASAAIIPLSYIRNWALGRVDDQGVTVGVLAVITLFINFSTTVLVFGGPTVVANYLPKLLTKQQKSSFFQAHSALCCALVAMVVGAAIFDNDVLASIIKPDAYGAPSWALLVLLPMVALSSLINYAQTGLMDYKSAALLSALPALAGFLVAVIGVTIAPESLAQHAHLAFVVALGSAYVTSGCVGLMRVLGRLKPSKWTLSLPRGFWKYSSLTHANTVISFLYGSVDQFVLLARVGVGELGAYFVMLQLAQFCTFIPRRIAQVMLASFSQLEGRADGERLAAAYSKLARLTVISTTLLILAMICASRWLLKLYGGYFEERYIHLVWLCAVVAIGAVGTINSMLVLSKERAGWFLCNNLTVITIQLLVTVLLVNKWGVAAVILGRAAGSIVGQIGNFAILRWGLPGIRLTPPLEWAISCLIVFGCCAVETLAGGVNPVTSFCVCAGSAVLFLVLVKFRINELRFLVVSLRIRP
jgi:O-antigen/teichoic acid export membrane protein